MSRFTSFFLRLFTGIGVFALPAFAADFNSFVDDYFKASFEWSPSNGTAAGFHEFDSRLENFSAKGIQARVARLKQQERDLENLRQGKLTHEEALDGQLISHAIRSELLDLETLKNWKTNPKGYLAIPGSAIDSLMKREFAPPAQRLQSINARLKAVPALMDSMRLNVVNSPKVFVEIGINMAEGSLVFFKTELAPWAEKVASTDKALRKDFERSNAVAIASLEKSLKWLKAKLLPNARGSFAIGSENFSKKLEYEEMVETPLAEVLAVGEAQLKKDHDAFVLTASQVLPGKTPEEAMKSLTDEHPTEETLLPWTKNTLEETRKFLVEKKIISLPSEVWPKVLETPRFLRDGGFAMMDTPGAFETKADEAFYYVTPPEKEWDAKKKEDYLRLFNASVVKLITIHEAFPGHYVQFLYNKQFPSKTRKLLYCNSNVEGWAHYAEQMMVDEGFGGANAKIRLAQLAEALIRDVRFVAGIKMHTAGLSVESATEMFRTQAYMEAATARGEARRGTFDPTYLYYTLGKIMIFQLREDYRKAKGKAYSLQAFHDAFIKEGGIPLKLMRERILPAAKRGSASR